MKEMNKMDKNQLIVVVLVVIALGAFAVFYSPKGPTRRDLAVDRGVNFVRSGAFGSAKSESLGEYLTDQDGITLYTYADDKKLESVCSGDCLKNWLPAVYDPNDRVDILTDSLSKKINAAKASDGSRQYAFGDKPLYYYLRDFEPGDANGHGLENGKWSIVPVETR